MKTKQTKIYLEDSLNCESPAPFMVNSKICSPNQEVNFHSSNPSHFDEKHPLESNKPQQAYKMGMEEGNPNIVQIMNGLGSLGINGVDKLLILNKRLFVTSTIPPGLTISTILRKQAKGLSSFLSPQYTLHLKADKTRLIHIKNYPLSRDIFKFALSQKGYSHKDQAYLGCMNCNLSEHQFWLRCPVPKGIILDNKIKNLEELKAIVNYTGEKNKNKIQAMMYFGDDDYTLGIRKGEERIKVEKLLPDQTLVLREDQNVSFQTGNKKNFVLKDEEEQCSQKNEDDCEVYQYLRFEENQQRDYCLEIKHPFSILQAVSIAMTRFEACLK